MGNARPAQAARDAANAAEEAEEAAQAAWTAEQRIDPIQKASHYNWHPSGAECFDIVRHFNFCKGGAIKYLWRAGRKGDGVEFELKDLKQGRRLIDEEIARVEAGEEERNPVAVTNGQLKLPGGWYWHDYDKPEIGQRHSSRGVTRHNVMVKQTDNLPRVVLKAFWDRIHELDTERQAEERATPADSRENEFLS